jgi:glycosyltransferase involved in cell wall biosynthesis
MLDVERDTALPPRPTVSVVIITRNEGAELQATVTNILATLPRDQREVIVVDDSSTDDSTAFLRELPEVLVLPSAGLGVARARNYGASRATGDVILFADAHVRAPARWHEPLCDALRDECVGAVAPGIYSITEPERICTPVGDTSRAPARNPYLCFPVVFWPCAAMSTGVAAAMTRRCGSWAETMRN